MTVSKELALRIHWPDHVEYGVGEAALDDVEKLETAVGYWRERFGVTRFYWRVDHWFIERYCIERREHPGVRSGWATFWQKISSVRFSGLAPFVDATRRQGGKAYLYIPFLDEGLPEELPYLPRGTPYPYQSRFSRQHPEFVEVNRSGTERQWGVLSYAYPEVRLYRLKILKALMEETDADGLHLCTRSYVPPAAFGDQFGFNDPVVGEFQKRYGVNIRERDFELEKWRRLRGEYVTQFLSETRALCNRRNWLLSVAIPRGDYFGPPYGNLFLDWRTWVRDRLVDELIVNVISGKHLTGGVSGYGYLCNTEDDMGLNPIDYDVETVNGPVCREGNCRLYVGAGIDLNRHSPHLEELRSLASLSSLDGFMITTGNLKERFAYDKRQRTVPWALEELYG